MGRHPNYRLAKIHRRSYTIEEVALHHSTDAHERYSGVDQGGAPADR